MPLRNENPRAVSFYFQVHQPRRLRPFRFFDIGNGVPWFDDELNRQLIRRIATNCYLPANRLLLQLIKKHPAIRVTFSVSGTALEQLEAFAPEVIESFRQLAATGSVEFLGETYFHSLTSVIDKAEFQYQVKRHLLKMESLLGVRPGVFRNTELIYSDDIGAAVHSLGFKGILLDGSARAAAGRSVHELYRHPDSSNLRLLLRNYSLSDDIALRFNMPQWNEWPLTPDKFLRWVEAVPGAIVNLGMDYETFGEHQRASTGIFDFLRVVLVRMAKSKRLILLTPTDAINTLEASQSLSVPDYTSWTDNERDLSAWLGNDMQKDAFQTLYALKHASAGSPAGSPAGSSGEISGETSGANLRRAWRYLQTSDHFYYMSTKKYSDESLMPRSSPFASPYEAFMNYMNVLSDLKLEIEKEQRRREMAKVNRVPAREMEIHEV